MATTDAVTILQRRLGKIHNLEERVMADTLNARVAMLIYEARMEAGLSQAELAELVGTSQPSIARLEDADYKGHSLTMLQRISKALGKRIEISLAPSAPQG
jgi:DNA-binding XRE family transcriptional regulator